jgi:hyperosmotically inducible periplasmic protein
MLKNRMLTDSRLTNRTRFLLPCLLCVAYCAGLTAQTAPSQDDVLRIAKEVRKQIVTLPQYGVFDDIHFAIKGSTVILKGEASRPTLKSSAENVVKKIEGVTNVQNEIEVLPLSPNDDRIRTAVYIRIYRSPTLQRYTSNRGPWLGSSVRRTFGITNDPPIGYHAIHIIVKNGNVTLKGIVDNASDLAIAGMQASMTPGVFSVDNDLQVAKPEKQ